MKQTAIGDLRHLLLLQTPQDVPDESGNLQRSFVALANVWAAVQPLSANYVWRAQQAEQQITHNIVIVWRADVTGEMRFLLGSRVFEIISVRDPDETGRFLVCDCWEIKP